MGCNGLRMRKSSLFCFNFVPVLYIMPHPSSDADVTSGPQCTAEHAGKIGIKNQILNTYKLLCRNRKKLVVDAR